MRLIDAEGSELQTQLKFIREAEYQIYGGGSWGFTVKCERAIENAPTIQPEPLQPWEVLAAQSVLSQPAEPKKGKWIKSGRWGRVYKCNQCGNFLDFDGVNVGRGDANFCPNCGAKMEVTE